MLMRAVFLVIVTGAISFSGFLAQPQLVDAQLTSEDCVAEGGTYYELEGGGSVCQFFGASCPAGWTKVSNWSTTRFNTCEWNGEGQYCNTGQHATFQNKAQETCSSHCGFSDTCTCYATITSVGCHRTSPPPPPDDPPPPEPPPPPPSGPSCSVTFDENPIESGEGTTIRWTSTGGEWFYINSIGYVQGSGSAWVQPSQTTNYDGEVGHTVPGGDGSGSQNFSTPGAHQFNIPSGYESLTVKVWGGGGGGRGGIFYGGSNGGAGGQSSFNGTVIANGGGGGVSENRYGEFEEFGGAGGTASGGDINQTGEDGQSRRLEESGLTIGGRGGDGANGGAGGAGGTGGYDPGKPGGYPSGGGGGAGTEPPSGAGGGGGGYSSKTYAASALSGTITVVVGAGGAGGISGPQGEPPGGAGAAGKVEITWTGGDGESSEVVDATCSATLEVTGGDAEEDEDDSGMCPAGYTGTPPNCVPTGPQCPAFYCVGDDLYQNDAQCTGSLVQTCAFGCAGGGCLPQPAPEGSITATPLLVQRGDSTTVSWNALNVIPDSCTVTEDNPSITDGGSGPNGSFTSSGLEERTIYTLTCTGEDSSLFTDSATVNVLPVFNEPRL